MTVVADTEKLLKQTDVAELLQVSRKTIARMVAHGQIPRPVISMGKVRRWRREDIQNHLERRARMG